MELPENPMTNPKVRINQLTTDDDNMVRVKTGMGYAVLYYPDIRNERSGLGVLFSMTREGYIFAGYHRLNDFGQRLPLAEAHQLVVEATKTAEPKPAKYTLSHFLGYRN